MTATNWDNSLDFTPPDPDRVSIIASDELSRRYAAGHLLKEANRVPSAGDNDTAMPINFDVQTAFADIGVKLATLTQFLLDTQVQQSLDGAYHLVVAIDPMNIGHYTIAFQYPQDADIGGGTINGVVATSLAAGSAPTVSIDGSGIIHFGIPSGAAGSNGTNGSNGSNGTNGVTPMFRVSGGYIQDSIDGGATYNNLIAITDITGATGANGSNGTNGSNGQSVTTVEATALPAGSAPTATYNASTGDLVLGLPTSPPGTGQPATNPPPQASSAAQTRCNIAGMVVAMLKDAWAQDKNAGSSGASAIGVAAAVFGIFLSIGAELATAGAATAALAAFWAFVLGAGVNNVDASLTSAVYETLVCIIADHEQSDATFSQANVDDIIAGIDAEISFDTNVKNFFHSHIQAAGVRTLNSAHLTYSAVTEDCSPCPAPTGLTITYLSGSGPTSVNRGDSFTVNSAASGSQSNITFSVSECVALQIVSLSGYSASHPGGAGPDYCWIACGSGGATTCDTDVPSLPYTEAATNEIGITGASAFSGVFRLF